MSLTIYYPFEKEGTNYLKMQLANGNFALVGVVPAGIGPAAMVVQRKDNGAIVIVFRGTVIRWSDILTDIFFLPIKTKRGWMHTGFVLSFNSIYNKLSKILDGVEFSSLYVTGHSLGAALAVIATSILEKKYSINSCYTFGCPRIGEEKIDWNIKTPVYRVTNSSDLVTHVPPALGKLYQHIGDIRFLTRVGTLLRNPSAIRFAISFSLGLFALRGLRSHGVYQYSRKLYFLAYPQKENQDNRILIEEDQTQQLDYFNSKTLIKPALPAEAYSNLVAFEMANVTYCLNIETEKLQRKNGGLLNKMKMVMLLAKDSSIKSNEQFHKLHAELNSSTGHSIQEIADELSKFEIELIQTITADDVNALILQKKDGTIIVTFAILMSDKSLNDMKVDFKSTSTKVNSGTEIFSIHSGVYYSYSKIEIELLNALNEFTGKQVYFTGHGFAGGLAIFAAMRVNKSKVVTACYAFGSPNLFSEHLDSLIPTNIYRIVNADDIVARFPRFRGMFSGRVGDLRYFTEDFTILRNPSWWRIMVRFLRELRLSKTKEGHSIDKYCKFLAKLNHNFDKGK